MPKFFKPAFALTLLALGSSAFAADAPGVTSSEIKIGGVFPFSGPASSLGNVGRGILASVQSINDRGGINGPKINYNVIYLWAIDAAAVVDRLDRGKNTSADIAERGGRSAEGEHSSDLDLG